MIERTFLTASRIAALACVVAMIGLPAHAQTPTTSDTQPTQATPAGMLSLGDIESRLSAQGISIRELEVRDLVVEVEGRDAKGKKIELLVDRRSGEILSQKADR